MYPAYNRVFRGNLVLRHFVPHFQPNFSRHCVLNGGTQRRGFSCQTEEMKILINNNPFPRVGIESTTVALQSHPCATTTSNYRMTYIHIFIIQIFPNILCKDLQKNCLFSFLIIMKNEKL